MAILGNWTNKNVGEGFFKNEYMNSFVGDYSIFVCDNV